MVPLLEPVAITTTVNSIPPMVIGDYHDIKEGSWGGECVLWLKKYLNTKETAPTFRGTAGDIQPTSQTPEVGSIVLLREGAEGHSALVIAMDDTDIYIADSNYNGDGIIHKGRKIEKGSARIRGYVVVE